MKISVSILGTELINLKSVLQSLDPQVVDYIHLDIMDGNFVPQLSFGESIANEIARATKIPLDVHLMVADPEKEVPKYFEMQPSIISFHIEATHAPLRLAQLIRSKNILAGIALSPGTPLESVEPLLEEIDLVLLMSVEPGYYGQSFLETSILRAQKLKSMIDKSTDKSTDRSTDRNTDKNIDKKNIIIEIDGGISAKNIARVKSAGVDLAVSASYCFSTPDINANVKKLKA